MRIRRVPGTVGTRPARVFDRSASDKVTYGHLPALDGAGMVALSLWVYPVSSASYDALCGQIGANGSGAGNVSGVQILHNATDATALFVSCRNNDSGAWETFDGLTLNSWNHVLLQFDGTQGTAADRVRLYIAGAERTSTLTSGTNPATLGTTDQPFVIGADSGGSTFFWTGRQADVAMWTGVVLTDDERRALALRSSPAGIRSNALVFHDPLNGPARNRITGAAGAVTGTTLGIGPANLQGPPTLRRFGAPAATYDTFRPSATASAGSWTAQPSGTLHGVTSDESDSTAARSSSGAGSDTLDLSFPAMGTPDAGTVTFYIRHQRT
jgi:hypothetical protein